MFFLLIQLLIYKIILISPHNNICILLNLIKSMEIKINLIDVIVQFIKTEFKYPIIVLMTKKCITIDKLFN